MFGMGKTKASETIADEPKRSREWLVIFHLKNNHIRTPCDDREAARKLLKSAYEALLEGKIFLSDSHEVCINPEWFSYAIVTSQIDDNGETE